MNSTGKTIEPSTEEQFLFLFLVQGECNTYILLYKRDMCVQILQGSSAHYLTETQRFSKLG